MFPTVDNHFELPSSLRKLSGMLTMVNKLLKNGYIKKLVVDGATDYIDGHHINSMKWIINCNQDNYQNKFQAQDNIVNND